MHWPHKIALIVVILAGFATTVWALYSLKDHRDAREAFRIVAHAAQPSFTETVDAYRALMERVGATEAQEILLKTLPNDSRTHMINHETGFYLYETEGAPGIATCKPYFAGGCFHGFVEAHMASYGYDDIDGLVENCRTLTESEQEMQCPHGVGHAMLIAAGYPHLPDALSMCEKAFPEDRKSRVNCYDGVFMENSFGAFTIPPSDRWYRSDDPMYPCNEPSVKEYEGAHLYCWGMQSQATLRADAYPRFGGDVAKVGEYCLTLANASDKKLCIEGIARQLQWKYPGDIHAVENACNALAQPHNRTCLWYAQEVGYIYGNRSPETMQMCTRTNEDEKPRCYRIFFEGIAIAYSGQLQREEACSTLPEFNHECISWMRSDEARGF